MFKDDVNIEQDSVEFICKKYRFFKTNVRISLIGAIITILIGLLHPVLSIHNYATWVLFSLGFFGILSVSFHFPIWPNNATPDRMAVTAKGVSLVEKNGDSILLPASLFSEVYIQIHRHRGPRKQHVVSNLVFVRGPGGIEILLGVLSSLDEAKESLQKIAALLAIESLPIYEFASNEHFQQESKVLPVTESATLQSIPELVRITERLKEAKVVQFSNDGRTIRVKNYNLILPFFTYLLLNIALVAAFLSFYLAEVSLTSLVVVGIIAIGVSGIAFYLSILDRYFDRAISIQPDGLLLRRFLRWLPTTDANYSNRDVDVSQDQLTIRCHFNRMTVQPRLISYAEAKRIARLSKTYRDFNERLNEPKLDRYDKGIEFTSLNYSEIIAVYSILIELVNRG